ncbi:MAG TPA: enoyl-CoA hydratase/isomerase family protein [Syntrophomonadaceae bacterium]|nr:enoyl-CoA hydratase/isomerase family protein [Syntrophomonadaceae bacterium]
MSFEYVIEDNIVVFKFNNGKVNAVSTETLKGLDEVIQRVNKEEELKGIVITGEGRYLSGGFDLNTFTSFKNGAEIIEWFEYEEKVLLDLFTCTKPVVAAINGHATAAGMIISMACDYCIAVNHPKIKVGMTEIKIGLALTPAEMEIMRFGLDTNKNMKDVIFKGELIGVEEAFERGIFDELAEDAADAVEKAKAKVSALIDTPGRPFILLKEFQKQHAAQDIIDGLEKYDWDKLVETFTDEQVVGTLKMVLKSIS